MRLQTRFLAYFGALAATITALAVLLVDEAMGDVLMGPAPRRLMRLALIVIALVTVGLGAAGAYGLGRRITRLLALLSAATRAVKETRKRVWSRTASTRVLVA